MKAIISVLAATLLALSAGPALAITVGFPTAVIDETSGITQPGHPDAVPGLPGSRLPAAVKRRPPEVKQRRKPRTAPAAVPAKRSVSVVPALPAAPERLGLDLMPLVDLRRPAKPAPTTKAGGLPGSTQLEVFGAELERPATASVQPAAAQSASSTVDAKTSKKGKKWVPERTLPRVGSQVLTPPTPRRW